MKSLQCRQIHHKATSPCVDWTIPTHIIHSESGQYYLFTFCWSTNMFSNNTNTNICSDNNSVALNVETSQKVNLYSCSAHGHHSRKPCARVIKAVEIVSSDRCCACVTFQRTNISITSSTVLPAWEIIIWKNCTNKNKWVNKLSYTKSKRNVFKYLLKMLKAFV